MPNITEIEINKLIEQAKQGATTYGDVMDNLYKITISAAGVKWHHFDAACNQVLQEMKSLPVGSAS